MISSPIWMSLDTSRFPLLDPLEALQRQDHEKYEKFVGHSNKKKKIPVYWLDGAPTTLLSQTV